MSKYSSGGFPNPYVSNKERNSEEYGAAVFKAILNSTSSYREKRLRKINEVRKYAVGDQNMRDYLKEVGIEDTDNMYVNVSFQPTKVMQKFEKIVVDDYQQLEEEPKVTAKSAHIQERKERKKSDLKFRMQYNDVISEIEQQVGFPIEDPNQQVPRDEEELELITSLNSDEREEVLMNEMLKFVLEDNDIDSKKRRFMSDTFQVSFGGYHYFKDKSGRVHIDFVSAENALYGSSDKELLTDIPYAGKVTQMSITDIRSFFNLRPEDEEKLYKIAKNARGVGGNGFFVDNGFDFKWVTSKVRPYDDYTVTVYHVWFKTAKTVGYVEGEDRYGKKVFDVDFSINNINTHDSEEQIRRKRKGVEFTETSYEGWFGGDMDNPVVIEWGESTNQTRIGEHKEKVLCPYIFFMPDNRGNLDTKSAVELAIPEIKVMDLAMLKIKLTIANHPPAGYAIDHESLMDVDLGMGDLSPLDLEKIYQQTGKLYYRKRGIDETQQGGDQRPIIPLDIGIQNTINTYLLIYNNALDTIRDTLGINPNREGTANINRASNQAIQTQIAISQTATYYIYRAFLKATDRLCKQLHIILLDTLKYGKPERGYLKYLGEQNVEFIKERKNIADIVYKVEFNPDITKEDKDYLQAMVNAAVSAGELSVEDALYINNNIKNVTLAEKYLRFLKRKYREEAKRDEIERQRLQAEAQGDMAVRVEEAKRETFQIQSSLQAQEWEIKGKNEKDVQALKMASDLIMLNVKEGKEIPEHLQEFVQIVIENYTLKQAKSLNETEKELQQEGEAEQQEEVLQQIQQGIDSGEITEEEGMSLLQDAGMV